VAIHEDEEVKLILNMMQMMLAMAPQRIKMAQVGRGGGKSTSAAIEIKDTVNDMPMSKNFILGETYQNILTRTLPSTIKALRLLGFHKDLNYFVGRYPPKAWKFGECYEPPLDPSHSIFFANGTVYDLLSEDVSSRGGNYASGIADEFQDADQQYFESNVVPTLRLEYDRFKDNPRYRRILALCSMPRTRKQEWIFNFEELAKKEPSKYFFISGPSSINRANLPPEWFEDQRRILLPSEYAIEIDNKRPAKVTGGFYPFFDDRQLGYVHFNNDHLEGIIDNAGGYNPEHFEQMDSQQDADVDENEALEISMDYGSWFNGIVTCQERGNVFRHLSAMSIDDKERFEDLLNKWCTYYRFHRNKTVYYWYDHTAKDTDSRTEIYPVIVGRVLASYGWTVIEMFIGMQPSPEDRYKFFGYAHKGDHPNLPTFLYNRHHCKWLIISMNGAKVIQRRDGKGFRKDKTDEGEHSIDQRTTTHFSDAHDTIAMGKYAHLLEDRAPMARPRLRRG
jgi:hypothetical protein